VSNPSIEIATQTTVRRIVLWTNGLWVLLGLIGIAALMPFVASPYVLMLMLPFIGYSIALLGFNLLFGSTGLLSFGHALFLGGRPFIKKKRARRARRPRGALRPIGSFLGTLVPEPHGPGATRMTPCFPRRLPTSSSGCRRPWR